MTIYIVDEAGSAPGWREGEIWVAGIGVGCGYLNQEEKTREGAHGEGPRRLKSREYGCTRREI
ncbi:hypothetical protein P7H15_13065 [Paenibacillus larvae]|nr:hypothetical protein [Paenibacillus larvae]MDT2293582.1 hypothetical protein [Paenibacillus larvae]